MRVNISVVGRFHAFDLAHQLQKHEVLGKLITTYPKSITERWGIRKENIVSEPLLEIIRRYKQKIPFVPSEVLDNIVRTKHAKKSASLLQDCDIFIGWSGSSLEALIEAKKQGKITILERGSSHYNYQMKILQEEYAKFGMEFKPNYRVWQQELLEYELADYISIPSSFVKRTFLENGVPEKKLLVNPYGVNLTEFKQIKKDDGVFRIIYAGGGTIRKGYHYLLQAFHELDLPNCELWHLGNVAEEMKPFLKRYKSKNWVLKGHQPQNQLYKFYSQGNMFVMPSLEEGLAMVQFQAMSCGLPLICTTNTGGEDLITHNGEEGFVVPIRDIEALKEKISYLYYHPEIAKVMGEKAKKRVEEGFSWDDYGERYVENLRTIYENHHL